METTLPDLTDPFVGLVTRKMTKHELARAIRLDIIAELDAVALYEAHIDATDDEIAKRILTHIMNEEKEHVAEFTVLLEYLDPDQATIGAEGAEHGKLMLQGIEPEEEPSSAEKSAPSGLTVGNLIGSDA